jgi:hypothetical protein
MANFDFAADKKKLMAKSIFVESHTRQTIFFQRPKKAIVSFQVTGEMAF